MKDLAGFECTRCNFKFTQKSSLIRHSKKCVDGRPRNLRKKSCCECSAAKTRCDLRRPSCSRCDLRKTLCSYPPPTTTSSESVGPDFASGNFGPTQSGTTKDSTLPETAVSEPLPFEYGQVDAMLAHYFEPPLPVSVPQHIPSPYPLYLGVPENGLSTFGDFSRLDNLSNYVPLIRNMPGMGSNESTQLAPTVMGSDASKFVVIQRNMEIIFRVTRTWPRMLAKGTHLPPIIHRTQLSGETLPTTLENCFILTKMWGAQRRGGINIIQQTVKKEMQAIVNLFPTFDERNLIAALQALTIYMLLLLFPSNNQPGVSLIDEKLIGEVNGLIRYVASTGLVLEEESNRVRPLWESWIHVSCKRRALLSLYTIHWAYSAFFCLPSLNCADLSNIPAPAAKYLWEANSKEQWESLYNRWLVQWDGPSLCQRELFDISRGVRMGPRVELWLEDADEFGMLFVALCKHETPT
ncbi:hypothetical protein ACO22_00167 [Paracoccidioides brasiliensis]|uniref:Uncharacterized protein n=1 Tax=Paracoccidioides brasiliensis TaxID=121759 RepID=A0A1D2JPY6_PARBR|nr:hypothetical protein ACO22_00167 [Paracoccidioides brasiliensis]ODH48757.1 hypothetical protein GX48_05082 [Paracoccidioides brasiliensis]